MTKTHDTPDTTASDSQPIALDRTVSRATMLKGAAAATGTLAAAPVASALAAPSRMAAPAIQRAPQGTIVIWGRAGDLFQAFDSTLASFNQNYSGITPQHASGTV